MNGLAGSVELYLGEDVLAQDDGTLLPVQWRAFIAGVRAYHGEVTAKEVIHSRFRTKVATAKTADLESAAWDDLREVLDLVMSAFVGRSLPPHICEHTGSSETRLRLRKIMDVRRADRRSARASPSTRVTGLDWGMRTSA